MKFMKYGIDTIASRRVPLDIFEGTHMVAAGGFAEIWDGDKLVAVTQYQKGESIRRVVGNSLETETEAEQVLTNS